MPAAEELPPSLAELAYRNAIEVDPGRDFHGHVDRLIRGIQFLTQQPIELAPRPPQSPPIHRTLVPTNPGVKVPPKSDAMVESGIERPNSTVDLFNRGNTRRAKGNSDDALADYSEVLRRNPTFAAAYFKRGNIKLGREQYEEAIADYDEAIHFYRQTAGTATRGRAGLRIASVRPGHHRLRRGTSTGSKQRLVP